MILFLYVCPFSFGRVLAARRQYAIRSIPNPLEFFGYVYCFSSILAGPAFEYTLYDDATSGEAYRKVSFADACCRRQECCI
ncbi:unnamed protein product [Laminaria digitata]